MNQAMTDIRDIHGPIVSHAHVIWPYFVVGAAVVLLVAIAARLLRRRPATPAEQALRALEGQRTVLDDPELFSTRACDVIRHYVEDAFGIHAPSRTTDELLFDLMTDDSPVAAHRAELGDFLAYCDLAKYARFSLSHEQMTQMLASAETFVRATAGGAA